MSAPDPIIDLLAVIVTEAPAAAAGDPAALVTVEDAADRLTHLLGDWADEHAPDQCPHIFRANGVLSPRYTEARADLTPLHKVDVVGSVFR